MIGFVIVSSVLMSVEIVALTHTQTVCAVVSWFTDTQTHTQSQTDTHTQIHRHTHRDRERQRGTESDTETHIDTERHEDTRTHARTYAQTRTHIHTRHTLRHTKHDNTHPSTAFTFRYFVQDTRGRMVVDLSSRERERFLDLLDFEKEYTSNATGKGDLVGRNPAERPHLNWSERCSAELQALVDDFNTEEFSALDFSVTVADPSLPDCPLVGCSVGFTSLTGYTVSEIVGRNCRFLLNGVPNELVDNDSRRRCREFSLSCSEGAMCMDPLGDMISGMELPCGELISVQTNARKSGELFRNMFYLKMVELDGNSFILGLQVERVPVTSED